MRSRADAPVLELDVNLVRAQVHERHLLNLATDTTKGRKRTSANASLSSVLRMDTHNKALAAKLQREDGAPNRALDSRALERNLQVHAGGLLDCLRGGNVVHSALDEDGLD